MQPLIDITLQILKESWFILRESSLYILLGFLIAGAIHVFLRTEHVARFFGKGKIRSVLYAALFGIPIPLCSCGVLPTAVALRKRGATAGATASFLISTPES